MIIASCEKCKLELRIDKEYIFDCPKCGNEIDGISIENKRKFLEKIEKYKQLSGVNEIKNILGKHDKTKKYYESLGLEDLFLQLEDFYEILRNPRESANNKAIALMVLGYLSNRFNLFGNGIPFFGKVDNLAIITLGHKLLNSSQANEDLKKVRTDKSVVYCMHTSKRNYKIDYYEKKDVCVVNLTPEDIKKYDLSLINDSLVNPPMSFFRHPYKQSVLVPIKKYNDLIMEEKFTEERKLFESLGAKKIKIDTYDFSAKSKKFKFEGNTSIVKSAIDGNLDIDNKSISYTKKTTSNEYGNMTRFDMSEFGELVWIFTNESEFKDIISRKLFRDILKLEIETEFKTEENLSVELLAAVDKAITIDVGFASESERMRVVRYEVEFYTNKELFNGIESPTKEKVRSVLNETKAKLKQRRYS